MKLQNIQQTKILDIEVQFAFENDVWFNATKMVKNFNKANGTKKRLDVFWKLDSTKEYIAELKSELTVTTSDVNRETMGFKQVINSFDEKNGTYIHPELGILLARYLSPRFARACDKFIKDVIVKKNTKQNINEEKLATTIATAVTQAIVQIVSSGSIETPLQKEKLQLEIDILKLDKIDKIAELSKKYNLEELGDVGHIPSELKPQLKRLSGSVIKEVRPAIKGISPTACLKQIDLNIKASDFYKLLAKIGICTYYEHQTPKGVALKWKLTDIGRYYGYNQPSSSIKELPFQVKLYPDRFGELLDLLRNEGYLD